jgi:hypothetical protein
MLFFNNNHLVSKGVSTGIHSTFVFSFYRRLEVDRKLKNSVDFRFREPNHAGIQKIPNNEGFGFGFQVSTTSVGNLKKPGCTQDFLEVLCGTCTV